MASYESQVAAAQNQRDAMLVIARALDVIAGLVPKSAPVDEWTGDWGLNVGYPPPGHPDATERRTTLIENEGNTDVVLPAVSEARCVARAQFEQQALRLTEHLGDGEDWNRHYQLGGPMWLYIGNRDLVMSYPTQIKQAMIEDVMQDSQEDAHEMARDILKHACEPGPGGPAMQIAQGDIG